MALLTFTQSSLIWKGKGSLSLFQQLLLTLVRLWLNLSLEDLVYRFGVHKSRVSRSSLEVMYVKLEHLLLWSDREILKATIPMDSVKHCRSCVFVIDCFEVFLERPSNVLARAQTYSSYKHDNTVKYLSGITRQGTVSFISEGWGGEWVTTALLKAVDCSHTVCPVTLHLQTGALIFKSHQFVLCSSPSSCVYKG